MPRLRECHLDDYTRLALPRTLARFPEWEEFAEFVPGSNDEGGVVEFNVPCPSPAVDHGLWVSTADEELSVGFHTHHRHFTDYAERTHVAQIEAGVEYAADIVAERIGVVSWYRGDTFGGSRFVILPYAGPLHELGGTVPLAGTFADCERLTLRSWLGRSDCDKSLA